MSLLTIDVWCGGVAGGGSPARGASQAPPRPPPRRRFYWSRSVNCCAEVRALLGCAPDPSAPCRGFGGDCGDLADQFRGIPYGVPDDYECVQFPDEKSARDKALVGLIAYAVALPFTLLCEELFSLSAEPEHPEGQLGYPFAMRALFGRQRWEFARQPPSTVKLARAAAAAPVAACAPAHPPARRRRCA